MVAVFGADFVTAEFGSGLKLHASGSKALPLLPCFLPTRCKLVASLPASSE
jgi:hypothetical protein